MKEAKSSTLYISKNGDKEKEWYPSFLSIIKILGLKDNSTQSYCAFVRVSCVSNLTARESFIKNECSWCPLSQQLLLRLLWPWPVRSKLLCFEIFVSHNFWRFRNFQISWRLGFLWSAEVNVLLTVSRKAGGLLGFVWFWVFCLVVCGDFVDAPDGLGLSVYGFLFSWLRFPGNVCSDGGRRVSWVMLYFCCSCLFLISCSSSPLIRRCVTCFCASTNRMFLFVALEQPCSSS